MGRYCKDKTWHISYHMASWNNAFNSDPSNHKTFLGRKSSLIYSSCLRKGFEVLAGTSLHPSLSSSPYLSPSYSLRKISFSFYLHAFCLFSKCYPLLTKLVLLFPKTEKFSVQTLAEVIRK